MVDDRVGQPPGGSGGRPGEMQGFRPLAGQLVDEHRDKRGVGRVGEVEWGEVDGVDEQLAGER